MFSLTSCGSAAVAPHAAPEPASYDDEVCAATGDDATGGPGDAGVTDLVGASASFTLRAGDPARRLADGCTTIELRTVHPTISLGEGGLYGFASARSGLPYVKTHGGWLEILHQAAIYSRGYLFEIENTGCQIVDQSCGDCVYQDIDSCAITVTTSMGKPAPLVPAAFDHLFSLDSRYDAVASTAAGSGWIALRGLGFFIGNLDTSVTPALPIGLDGAVDIVTSFGVANLDFDYFDTQVIGATGTAAIGPHQIGWTIDDVGNVNTHCAGDGGCRDVFDFAVTASVSDGAARLPAIVSYR